MIPEREALVAYRLEQVTESLECAQMMIDGRKYRPAVNRAYYAMFYSVLALLAVKGQASSKHSGVMGAFDHDYVKPGLLPRRLSTWLHEAFDLRQRADYREMFRVPRGTAARILKNARAFAARVEKQVMRTVAPAPRGRHS